MEQTYAVLSGASHSGYHFGAAYNEQRRASGAQEPIASSLSSATAHRQSLRGGSKAFQMALGAAASGAALSCGSMFAGAGGSSGQSNSTLLGRLAPIPHSSMPTDIYTLPSAPPGQPSMPSTRKRPNKGYWNKKKKPWKKRREEQSKKDSTARQQEKSVDLDDFSEDDASQQEKVHVHLPASKPMLTEERAVQTTWQDDPVLRQEQAVQTSQQDNRPTKACAVQTFLQDDLPTKARILTVDCLTETQREKIDRILSAIQEDATRQTKAEIGAMRHKLLHLARNDARSFDRLHTLQTDVNHVIEMEDI